MRKSYGSDILNPIILHSWIPPLLVVVTATINGQKSKQNDDSLLLIPLQHNYLQQDRAKCPVFSFTHYQTPWLILPFWLPSVKWQNRNRKGMKKSIPTIGEREGNEKKHSQNSGTGRECKNPFPKFRKGNQRLSFLGMDGNGNSRLPLSSLNAYIVGNSNKPPSPQSGSYSVWRHLRLYWGMRNKYFLKETWPKRRVWDLSLHPTTAGHNVQLYTRCS